MHVTEIDPLGESVFSLRTDIFKEYIELMDINKMEIMVVCKNLLFDRLSICDIGSRKILTVRSTIDPLYDYLG